MSSKSPRQNKRGLGRLLDVAMTHAAIIISLAILDPVWATFKPMEER